MSKVSRNIMSWKRTVAIAVTGLLLLATSQHIGLSGKAAFAQVQLPMQMTEGQSETPPKDEKRPLEAWQTEVKQKLSDLEKRIAEIKSAEESPPGHLSRQEELLSRIELTLSQAISEDKGLQELASEVTKQQEQLDSFIQEGISDPESVTFMQLDEARDELGSEQRRLSRLLDKSQDVLSTLETAQEKLRECNAARRRAKEAFETNDDATLRQAFGEKLAESELLCDAAEATVRLREIESEHAKRSHKIQDLRVKLQQEKAARMGTFARFGEAELQKLFTQFDREQDDLESEIAKIEAAEAAEPAIKYLEEQWMRAQRQLDEATGDKKALRAEVQAHQLSRQSIQERLTLLAKQLARLEDRRKVWEHRQQATIGRLPRMDVRMWIEQSEEEVVSLKREERTALLEIEEFENELKRRRGDEEQAGKSSFEAKWIGRQVKSLEELLASHEQDLSSLRDSLKLHVKLLKELESGSLAATAKDRLQDLKNGISAAWEYELASFDEGKSSLTVRKVVTALLILFAGVLVSKALSRFLGRQVLRRLDIDASASATIQSLFYYTLLLFFALFALNVVRVPLAAFTVLGGAVALGVGFGSQNIINNFISGLILHAERPVKVGDLIQLDDLYGNVEHIGARSTRVRTGSNLEIIVPNSTFLQSNVINFTLSSDKVRTFVEVGVVYGSPVVTVTQLLRRAVLETGRVSKNPPPIILFKNFGDSALVFEVHFWVNMRSMMERLQVESAVRYRMVQLFEEEDITIAFPQTDVHLNTTAPLVVQMAETTQSDNDTE